MTAQLTEWTSPWSEIVATLHQAQIADGNCDYTSQLEAIEDALAQLDVLRQETEGAIATAHLRAANYSMRSAEK